MTSKPFVSANFDNYSLPGGGDFDNFFQKMSKAPPYARTPPHPPALGLNIDRCIGKRQPDKSFHQPRAIGQHFRRALALIGNIIQKLFKSSLAQGMAFETTPPPWNFIKLPQMHTRRQPCVFNNMTPSQTQTSFHLRETLSFERQG